MTQLTHDRIKNARPGKDGKRVKLYDHQPGGLFVMVGPRTKAFYQRALVRGKRLDLKIGVFPEMGLAAARAKCRDNLTAIVQGGDPRRKHSMSFEDAAAKWLDERKDYAAEQTHRNRQSRLARHVYPKIGHVPVGEVDAPDIKRVLLPLVSKRAVQKYCSHDVSAILAWAVAENHRNLPDRTQDVVNALPPTPMEKSETKHRPCVPWQDAPMAYHAALATSKGEMHKLAFRYMVLTQGRSEEALRAKWSEISEDAKTRMPDGTPLRVWTVEVGRMKKRRTHTVPLSPQAVAVLEEAAKLGGRDGLIFKGKGARGLGRDTFKDIHAAADLKAKDGQRATPHGWRSTFSDWAVENEICPPEVVKAALSQATAGRTLGSYIRTSYIDKRVDVMRQWADYVTKKPASSLDRFF